MRARQFACMILGLILCIRVAADIRSWAATVKGIDHTIYAELLGKYVSNGRVDYSGFKSEEANLDRYLENLAAVDTQNLARGDQFAFYINAYNAWTIKLILTGYPGVQSIKDLAGLFQSPWKKKIVRIDRKVVTLDHVEHNILRPRFKDPRIHFAINCAAKSCPPLRSEPYTGERIDQQLDDSTAKFLNSTSSYRIEGNTFYVSRIFKWFAQDFGNDVLQFYMQYASEGLKKKLEANKSRLKIAYLDYDWGLNGQ